MKYIANILILIFSVVNGVFASEHDSLRPQFNYALFRELKNEGEYNAVNLKVGPWIEFVADSGQWKESIDHRNFAKNVTPPHRIMLAKCVGEYVKGKRDGVWNFYRTYDSKQPLKWVLMETWTFTMGSPNGVHRAYYDTGELMVEMTYINGKQNGAAYSYTREGIITDHTEFVDGKSQGRSERYSNDGKLLWSGELMDGLYHGIVKEYYNNGQLRSAIEYKMGKAWTMIEVFSRYGSTLDKGTLRNGTGLYYDYNEGGCLVATTSMMDGKYNGTFRTYFLGGDLQSECVYRNDTMTGVYRDFFPEGGLMYLKNVVNGVVDGPVLSYYKNGKLKSEEIYKNGRIWATVYANDTSGKKINCGNIKMGSGTLLRYDDSGRVCLKETYSFGYLEGIVEQFYPNGKLATRTNYYLDMPHGDQKSYNELGTLVASSHYNNGITDGIIRSYHTNGRLFEVIYYYEGRIWDIISMSDSLGKALNPGTFKNGNGKLNGYYANGKLFSVREMMYGLDHGVATSYYRDGKKLCEYEYYQNGLLADQKEYWHNGQLAAERIIGSSGEDEKLIQYHSNGTVWTIWEFDDGLVWTVNFNNDANGNPHEKGTFSKGTGTLLRYDEQDSVIFEYKFVNGFCLNCDFDRTSIMSK